jgi:hypothetical protein
MNHHYYQDHRQDPPLAGKEPRMAKEVLATVQSESGQCVCGHSDLDHAYRKFTGYLHCERCSCAEFTETEQGKTASTQEEADNRLEIQRDKEMVADTLEQRAEAVAERMALTGQEFEAQLIEELLTELEERPRAA